MNTTIAIIIVLLVVAVVILVKLKKLSGQSEPESELDIPRESGIQKALEVPKDGQQLFKKAREVQQKYWSPNPDEKKRLVEKGFDNLVWDETLRLLHLACLEMLSDGPCKEQLLDEEIALEVSTHVPPGENRDLIVKTGFGHWGWPSGFRYGREPPAYIRPGIHRRNYGCTFLG